MVVPADQVGSNIGRKLYYAAMHHGFRVPVLLCAALLTAPAVNAGTVDGPPPAAKSPAPPPLPEAVRKMLETAIASGNEGDISAVSKIAQQTNPEASAEIAAMVNAHRATVATARQEKLSDPNMLALWDGRGELGGFLSTGSAEEVGISAGISIQRQGLKWLHKIQGSADYRRANGATSRERFVGSYETRYQFDPKGYTYGLGQFERDPFLGYESRYTASFGVGYRLVQNKSLDLSMNLGPSVRFVDYTLDETESKVGARSSYDLAWKLTPAVTFRQNGSAYLEDELKSATLLTSLDARLISRVTARLSYNVQREAETLLTDGRTDTLSKVTLVYDF
jgi:putative salt-induced outer membrane protein